MIPLFKGKLEGIRADALKPVLDVHVETLCRETDLPGQGQEGIVAPGQRSCLEKCRSVAATVPALYM